MALPSFLNWLNYQRALKRRPRPETLFMEGIFLEIGILSSYVKALDDEEAQRLVTRCGQYLWDALEEQFYKADVENFFKVAGLGADSHLGPDPFESRAKPDQELYGRILTPKERLIDRAQRLDNILKTIMLFGFDNIRSNQKMALEYLYDLQPTTASIEGQAG